MGHGAKLMRKDVFVDLPVLHKDQEVLPGSSTRLMFAMGSPSDKQQSGERAFLDHAQFLG
jgi:hypothetical protein